MLTDGLTASRLGPTGRDGPRGTYLKHPAGHVETQRVKICPRCEAELKDSVIRCVRCGTTVRGEEEREAVATATPPAAFGPSAKAPATAGVWGGTATAAVSTAAPTTSHVGRAPVAPGRSPIVDRAPRRALPTRRAWGPDPILLLAGLVAMAAGALAYLAIKEPWVHLTVTRAATDTDPALVATLSLRGKGAFVGTAGTGLAIALAALGLVWFFYGFQRGWTMPGIVNPGLGLLVTTAGLIAAVLSAMVWFVWEDAMVLRAKAAGMSMEAMKKLLDLQPAPLVQIQRLSGLLTFGGMMLLGLLASCLGWVAYRRRE